MGKRHAHCVVYIDILGTVLRGKAENRYRYIYIKGASLRGRYTPPATLAQEGKYRAEKEKSMLDCKCKLAT